MPIDGSSGRSQLVERANVATVASAGLKSWRKRQQSYGSCRSCAGSTASRRVPAPTASPPVPPPTPGTLTRDLKHMNVDLFMIEEEGQKKLRVECHFGRRKRLASIRTACRCARPLHSAAHAAAAGERGRRTRRQLRRQGHISDGVGKEPAAALQRHSSFGSGGRQLRAVCPRCTHAPSASHPPARNPPATAAMCRT